MTDDGARWWWMLDGRGVRDASRASCKHEDGSVAWLWSQHIIGAIVPFVALVHFDVVGIMMCPHMAVD